MTRSDKKKGGCCVGGDRLCKLLWRSAAVVAETPSSSSSFVLRGMVLALAALVGLKMPSAE